MGDSQEPSGGRPDAHFPQAIYQHPLGYLLGLQGLALLRAFAGEYGEEFTHARITEIAALLERSDELGPGVWLEAVNPEVVYAGWAAGYDTANNNMVRQEQPLVWEILDSLPIGVALDAACGTGRHASYLAQLGHRVIGVDISEHMLAIARQKLPAAEFHQASLDALPLPDASVDAVVCGLALMHVADLEPDSSYVESKSYRSQTRSSIGMAYRLPTLLWIQTPRRLSTWRVRHRIGGRCTRVRRRQPTRHTATSQWS